MKEVLAVVTPALDENLGSAARYALSLAGHMIAHVTILVAEIELEVVAPMAEPDNMQGCGVPADSPTKAERVALTIELARNAAKLANVACTVLDGRSPSLRDSLIDRAQLHDCTIIDVQGTLRHPRQGLVEGVLFGSGRPLILTPANASPPVKERVVVAWDGTPAAVRALHDAIPLLAQAQEVIVVSVTGDKEFTAGETGPHVCRYLSRWDVRSRFDLIERGDRNVGEALLDHAMQEQVRLLVMGGFGHPREREFLFGSATRDIFQSNCDIAVLLSH
jgi:nucleotide-binding universal stress UspA family protein